MYSLLQEDFLQEIRETLGKGPWVSVYESVGSLQGIEGRHCFFSALIPNAEIEDALNHFSWDLRIGAGKPGHSVSYEDKKEKIEYWRYGDSSGVVPLVIHRHFHGLLPESFEILEEFRHFHNLYFDSKANKYVALDPDGNEEDVVLVSEKCIKIRLGYLKNFLAVKDMHLALFFDRFAYSDRRLEELGIERLSEDIKEPLLSFHRSIVNFGHAPDNEQKSFSRVVGKKLIPGTTKEGSGFWPYAPEKQYEEFIIGTDKEGRPVQYTCDSNKLRNYFGANPKAPHQLTPVFFRREVLSKYYSNPKRFSVEDGYLRCGGLWGLRMDNNHDKYVIVYLCDLGDDLSHQEQLYWKSYNVLPDGAESDVNFKRSILAQFTDPERADLKFKMKFDSFSETWKKSLGWPLFKPLRHEDEHFYTSLRIPIVEDASELDSQSLALAKIIVDSINEAELVRQCSAIPADAKGIAKLEIYFREHGFADYDRHIKFLRDLFDLRNGAGHRKGDKYDRAAERFRVDELPPSKCFETILMEASTLLDYLNDWVSKTQKAS
ncbi:MAG: hypothetical protein WC881_02000 [Elusimicrobiota bacterium]|jgi:hypothetical protein